MGLKSLSILRSRMFMYRFYRLFPQWNEFETKYTKDCSIVIKEFHKDLMKAVATERYGVELPLNMGKLFVISYKSRPYTNFIKFSKEGELSKFTNNHTDGHTCKIVYQNSDRKYQLKDKKIWDFEVCTEFRKIVSKEFAKDYTRYIFSPNRVKINNNNLKNIYKQHEDKKIEKFLLTYDEFKMN